MTKTIEDSSSVVRVSIHRDGRETTDHLVVEEPLEIRVDGRSIAVVLRTPGDGTEEDLDLAVGFLVTEGVIDGADDLTAVGHCIDPARPNRQNVVQVSLASGTASARKRLERAERNTFVGSSCGVCGKATIDRVFQHVTPLAQPMTLAKDFVAQLPQRLRDSQPRFSQTGGLHGAAILTREGVVCAVAEDIGRHNAVDKVIGHLVRADKFPLEEHILVVSSRAGFEIVQKALMARIGAVVAVGAASSLAHTLAKDGRMTLYSFVREGRFNEHRPL